MNPPRLWLIVWGAALGGCGGDSAQLSPVRLLHDPPVVRLAPADLRALAMQCESYPQQGSFRGRYDADYCEQAIQAWGDAPLQLVIIDHQNALPAPDTPASR
jgi:hypothetical protein